MAKNSVRDFSSTAASNTDIQSIDIDENCAASGINNAIREVMADLKDVSVGTVALESPKFDSILDGNIKATDASGTDTAGTATTIKGGAGTGTGTGGSIVFQVADADASTGSSVNAHATAMTIVDDGNVGIGTTSPDYKLELEDSGNVFISLKSSNTTDAGVVFGDADAAARGGIIYDNNDNYLAFRTNDNTERMRIDSGGAVGIGTTTPERKLDVNGAANFSSVVYARSEIRVNSNANVASAGSNSSADTGARIENAGGSHVFVSRSDQVLLLNRQGTDGAIITFYGQGNSEGSISVSGGTISYNGGHLTRWSRLPNDTKDTSIVKGTVMTNLDEMIVWQKDDGTIEDNEQLNKTDVSSVEGDINVAGVFDHWDEDDDEGFDDDFYLAETGDFVIRIAQGTTVARGDLLMSAGDGTAKPQGDDIVRSKTIAKVTSTHVSHTYDDGSYLVPCVLMAC
jgi:hypothetical protein